MVAPSAVRRGPPLYWGYFLACLPDAESCEPSGEPSPPAFLSPSPAFLPVGVTLLAAIVFGRAALGVATRLESVPPFDGSRQWESPPLAVATGGGAVCGITLRVGVTLRRRAWVLLDAASEPDFVSVDVFVVPSVLCPVGRGLGAVGGARRRRACRAVLVRRGRRRRGRRRPAAPVVVAGGAPRWRAAFAFTAVNVRVLAAGSGSTPPSRAPPAWGPAHRR